jgi:hypothetical protein
MFVYIFLLQKHSFEFEFVMRFHTESYWVSLILVCIDLL